MAVSENNDTHWLDRWQNNNIGFHLDQINPNLQTFWPTLSAKTGDSVFVPLCGKSLDMLWLQQQKLKVSGADLSPIAVEAFFKENQLPVQQQQNGEHQRWYNENIEIYLGDFFALPAGSLSARYIYDRAALIAIPPELQADYVKQLLRIAPDTQEILLSALSYDASLMQGPPYATPKEQVEQLFHPYFNVELLKETLIQPVKERFRQKGLESMTDYVFKLTRVV